MQLEHQRVESDPPQPSEKPNFYMEKQVDMLRNLIQMGAGEEGFKADAGYHCLEPEVSQVRRCWGCNAMEKDVPFSKCAKCVEEKLPSSYFCSGEC